MPGSKMHVYHLRAIARMSQIHNVNNKHQPANDLASQL